ncbi:hypothetical protein GMES_2704 [Paraglaciecola mesophila KMM 241]|uniref:Uncharacterized protein n=1 Tax=Paraglaciecola mesophila KMM 241 TaxID=1128912 RepID=K6XWJ5_9ALTE|nr:hypothetical protein GMES_2704 [Paraglaciecola mesophila KMM 241]
MCAIGRTYSEVHGNDCVGGYIHWVPIKIGGEYMKYSPIKN